MIDDDPRTPQQRADAARALLDIVEKRRAYNKFDIAEARIDKEAEDLLGATPEQQLRHSVMELQLLAEAGALRDREHEALRELRASFEGDSEWLEDTGTRCSSSHRLVAE